MKISASAIELGFDDDYWDSRDSIFSNGLSVRSSSFKQKMSASAVELCFEDDFWDSRDSVFINGLSVSSIVTAHQMSASDVELGFLNDFWGAGTKFSSTVSEAAVVCVH